MRPISDIRIVKITSQSMASLFILLIMFLKIKEKFLILMKSSLSVLSHFVFFVSQEIFCLPQRFSLMFWYRSFIVLAFMFTSVINFKLIFIYDIKLFGIQLFQHHLLRKDYPFSTELPCHFCQKSVSNMSVLLNFLIYEMNCMSILTSVLQWLDHCSFKSGNRSSPILCFFFKIVLAF